MKKDATDNKEGVPSLVRRSSKIIKITWKKRQQKDDARVAREEKQGTYLLINASNTLSFRTYRTAEVEGRRGKKKEVHKNMRYDMKKMIMKILPSAVHRFQMTRRPSGDVVEKELGDL